MGGSSTFAHFLRQAAPTLSRRFFSCQHQIPKPFAKQISTASRPARPIPTHDAFGQARKPFAKCQIRCIITPVAAQMQPGEQVGIGSITAASHAEKIVGRNAVKTTLSGAEQEPLVPRIRGNTVRSARFPDTSSNTVGYWLLASAVSVFGIVIFGGWTRLTESGLSITEWKPVTGSLPLSDQDWASEFEKYKASPEFHLLNSRMTLDEFKSIYWMEWIHRLWGRAIGITFVLPAAYFVLRKRVSKPMAIRLAGVAGLIGFQGFIGWWMVKSGLKDDLFAPGSHPRVSQYRLTAHLGTAFLCYVAMFWNGLSILQTNRLLSLQPENAQKILGALKNPALRPFQLSVGGIALLVFTTAMSGGLVAGLDAGLIYNEFPYMGLGLTPPKSELFSDFYSRDPEHKDLWWRNMLENPSLVQLDHRILATTTFTAIMALWAYSRFSKNMLALLPRAAKRGVHGVVGFAWLQVILGISTLIYLVPLPLASAHQAGSLALLTWTLVLGRRVWFPKGASKVLERRLALRGGNGEIERRSLHRDPFRVQDDTLPTTFSKVV